MYKGIQSRKTTTNVQLYDDSGKFIRHCVSLGHAARFAGQMRNATARLKKTGQRFWWDDREGGWYKIVPGRDAPTFRMIQRAARRDRGSRELR